MGELFRFSCPSCGYAAEIAGGGSRGFFSCTETIACNHCKALYDVVVSSKFPPTQDDEGTWTEVPIRCPKSRKHSWTKWENPGPCPKCGSMMMKKNCPTVLWD